jgi:hypothetical protein
MSSSAQTDRPVSGTFQNVFQERMSRVVDPVLDGEIEEGERLAGAKIKPNAGREEDQVPAEIRIPWVP